MLCFFDFFFLKCSGYCIKVICFAMLFFSWSFGKTGTFLLLSPFSISGLLASSALSM